jgi:hypothetical protein
MERQKCPLVFGRLAGSRQPGSPGRSDGWKRLRTLIGKRSDDLGQEGDELLLLAFVESGKQVQGKRLVDALVRVHHRDTFIGQVQVERTPIGMRPLLADKTCLQ